MVLNTQSGFGVQPFGAGGFGMAGQYVEQPFNASENPVLAFRNVFAMVGSTTQLTLGSDAKGTLPNIWNGDVSRPAVLAPELAVISTSNNVALYSEQLDHPYWAAYKSNFVTITPNDDGIADKFSAGAWNASSWNQTLCIEAPLASSAQQVTCAIEVRQGLGQYVQMCIFDAATGGAGKLLRINFDLINKTALLMSDLGAMFVSASAVLMPDGYVRCILSINNPVTISLNFRPIQFCDAVGDIAGNTSGMFHWLRRAQVAEGYASEPPYVGTLDTAAVTTQYDAAQSVLQLVWTPPNTGIPLGFGMQPFGVAGFGGYLPQATPVDCLIFAASRHDAAGLRSVPVRYRIWAESGYGEGGFGAGGFGGSVLDRTESPAANASLMRQFQPVNAARVTVTLWGLPAVATLPELFLGHAVAMPYLELGFDPYNEVSTGQNFLSESGREYPQLRYRKMELSPKWSYVEKPLWPEIRNIIENALELKNPVWFAWMPNSLGAETYYMRNNAKSAPFPYVNAMYRSLSLSLVEVL